MGEKRVRICDIAGELGLSTATVSNVLHGKTEKISDETVKRVQALLEERQYIPSMAGILLAQNSSRIIGVVINDHEKYEGHTLEDCYIAACLNSLSEEIEKSGLFMMVKKTTVPREIIRFASMWNLEGLVLMGFCDEDYTYLRTHMRIPFVVYDGYGSGPQRFCNITVDNYSGGFQVGMLFRDTGHRRALCIADNSICMDQERYEGFRAAFGEEGTGRLLVPMQKEARWEFYRENRAVFSRYTCIFAVSDYYAIDLMQFLAGQGIPVPEEVSVAGFDDTPVCRMIRPTLTSVRQDVAVRAKMALQKLRELKEKGEIQGEIRLPVTLVERDSTRKRGK